MIVEFFGISGAGKTTIANRYALNMTSKGKSIIWETNDLYSKRNWFTRNVIKSLVVLKFLFNNPRWVFQFYRYIKTEIKKKRDLGNRLFNGIYLKTLYAKAQEDEVIYLFDEGIAQFLWAIKLRSGKDVSLSDLDIMIDFFGSANQVIVIEADDKTIAKRITQRGQYVRIMDDGNLLDQIKKMRIIQNNIVRCIQQKKILIEHFRNEG